MPSPGLLGEGGGPVLEFIVHRSTAETDPSSAKVVVVVGIVWTRWFAGTGECEEETPSKPDASALARFINTASAPQHSRWIKTRKRSYRHPP
jgi:hypothetical protein